MSAAGFRGLGFRGLGGISGPETQEPQTLTSTLLGLGVSGLEVRFEVLGCLGQLRLRLCAVFGPLRECMFGGLGHRACGACASGCGVEGLRSKGFGFGLRAIKPLTHFVTGGGGGGGEKPALNPKP